LIAGEFAVILPKLGIFLRKGDKGLSRET
jgi:uncharacterized membrane protein YqaE (UPF0057 family)